MNMHAFEVFGERRTFALEMCLLPDPDGDATAPASSVGSWGRWRLWANGLNLTEHELHLDDGSVVRVDSVTWYLAPLLRWNHKGVMRASAIGLARHLAHAGPPGGAG